MIKWLLVLVFSTGETRHVEYQTQQECEENGIKVYNTFQKINTTETIQIFCAEVQIKGEYMI